jgi:hypothetical protein
MLSAANFRAKRAFRAVCNGRPLGAKDSTEEDEKSYALSGDTRGIRPGDRMKLQGKSVRAKRTRSKRVSGRQERVSEISASANLCSEFWYFAAGLR